MRKQPAIALPDRELFAAMKHSRGAGREDVRDSLERALWHIDDVHRSVKYTLTDDHTVYTLRMPTEDRAKIAEINACWHAWEIGFWFACEA